MQKMIKKIIHRNTSNYMTDLMKLIWYDSLSIELLVYYLSNTDIYCYDVNYVNEYGQTALFYACWKSMKYSMLSSNDNFNYLVIKTLVEYGANVNMQDADGDTAIMILAWYDNSFPIVTYLIETGNANITIRNNDEQTVLDIARNRGRYDYTLCNYLEKCKK